ncbi:MAG TPA: porin [Planctomycetaceae bacterium]|nr:porin [Planctomycetaceae bacterium]
MGPTFRVVELVRRRRIAVRWWQTAWLAVALALIAHSQTVNADPPDNDPVDAILTGYDGSDWLEELHADGFLKEHDRRSTDEPRIRLRGRIDTDFLWTSQSPENKATFGDLGDAAGLRRARIGVEGHLTPDSRYVAEIDLASGEVVLRDVYVGWGELRERGELRTGHFREPFSLEGATSANSFAFLERSPINELDPARNWGVGYFRCSPGEEATFAVGAFHAGTDSSDIQGGPGSETAITARATLLPWYESHGERLMHLGVALSSRLADEGVVIIKQGTSSPLLDLGDSSSSPFVPKITIPANFEQRFNAQWALVNGPFSMQAEWSGTLIDQTGGPPVFYHGSYLSAGYFLTGGQRRYQPEHGTFGAVTVARPVLPGLSLESHDAPRGWGAWEVTARFGYLDYFDLDAPRGPQGQLVGARLSQSTLGVNWYLAERLRILADYSLAVPDEPNTGTSTAHIFSMRLGLFW